MKTLRTKALIVDSLHRLPTWLWRPAGAIVCSLWRGSFPNA
jgi:hypothetical protein